MKRLKGILFAYMLKVLNSPASTMAQFKRKTLSKKVCPWLDPAFKLPPPAGRGTPTASAPVCGRSVPVVPSPAAASPVLTVGSIAMACDTPPPSSPTPSPRAQGPAPSASPAPCSVDVGAFLAGLGLPPSPPHPLSRGRRPNALLPPFPPLCALRLVPVVLWGLRLPPLLPFPHAPAAPTAGPCARSTSLGTPPLSGLSPTPFPLLTPPSSSRPRSTPGLRRRSRPVPIAPGIPWMPLTAVFTYAACTSRRLLPPLAPSLLAPSRRLSPCPGPIHFIMFFGPTPSSRYLPPFFMPFTTLLTDLSHAIVCRVHSMPITVDSYLCNVK